MSPIPVIFTFCLALFLNSSCPNRLEIFHCSFNLNFPDNDVDHLFTYILAICTSSLEKYQFESFAHFLMGLPQKRGGTRKCWEMLDRNITLTAMVVTCVFIYVYIYQIVYIEYEQFFIIYTSIKLLKNKSFQRIKLMPEKNKVVFTNCQALL